MTQKLFVGIRGDQCAGLQVHLVSDAPDCFKPKREGYGSDEQNLREWFAKVHRERPLLDPRLDLRNHSPSGFECGYVGSGPAQLAVAICAAVLEDDALHPVIYQEIHHRLVATLPSDRHWVVSEREVLDLIAEARAQLERLQGRAADYVR